VRLLCHLILQVGDHWVAPSPYTLLQR
jgi:hypothetical protein